MKNLSIFILFIFNTLLAFSQSDTTKYGVVMPKGFTSEIDIVYDKVGDWEGKFDLYLPPNNGTPTPIVINIHGGGWNHGSKETQKGFASFFKKNMAVANMSYRLVDVAPAPAAIEDVRSVMAYLFENAERLNIDPTKIVLMGGSAGGHLAMMGGYLNDNTAFDKGRNSLQDIQVAAVIDKYGIADMVDFSVGEKPYKSAVKWVGEKNIGNREFIKSISPIYYINAQTPPTFIVHGNADPIVPYQQSVLLKEKLDQAGVYNEFITVEGGEHGKFPKDKMSEISKATIQFLEKVNVIE